MRWTKEQYESYQARRALQGAKPEPTVRHEPLAAAQGKAAGSPRIVVRIASFRVRLLDPDNLAGGAKYIVDGLRYAGLIPDDSPDQIILEVSQKKVTNRNQELTSVEIEL